MLIDENGTQAAIRAGYASKGAAVQAVRLLRKANVQQVLARLRDAIATETGVTIARTIKEMGRLAYFDFRKLYKEDGSLKLPSELDDDTAAGVAGIEVREEFAGKEGARELVGYVRKFRFVERNGAVANLARHQGLFDKDTLELKGNPFKQLFEILEANRSRGLLPSPVRQPTTPKPDKPGNS